MKIIYNKQIFNQTQVKIYQISASSPSKGLGSDPNRIKPWSSCFTADDRG